MKYSDLLADWLVELGYTTCFYVAGGNIMHLLESCSRKLKCVPVVHEISAGIATEYFNETSIGEKAFALVTAGPGLTNIVSAIGGAWLESRELLVLGGQVKTADLSRGKVRQRGIQEINGVAIVSSITDHAYLLDEATDRAHFRKLCSTHSARKGPVFIEIPLDIQGGTVDETKLNQASLSSGKTIIPEIAEKDLLRLKEQINAAKRPLLLIGGGIDRAIAEIAIEKFSSKELPITTTWNGADRINADHPLYFGRPNTWGMRYSNLILQQADLLIALGTRLGMQQTGFNWQEFVPLGKVVQVDCDADELNKNHPKVFWPLQGDANQVLRYLAASDLGHHSEWLSFCREIKHGLPLSEECNKTRPDYISPQQFVQKLASLCTEKDIIIPCSSGSAFTVMMQVFMQKKGQKIVTNKGLASMGYGLAGAIGAAFQGHGQRTILVEGDGGFSQNIQELGTVAINKLNLKIFIFDDNGYASIRMTQSNYFGGRYMGCDTASGLGLPNWEKLFAAYDLPVLRLRRDNKNDAHFEKLFDAEGPAAFIVTVDPEQTYFPKITSRVTENGSMVSNPLHLMTPALSDEAFKKFGKFLLAKNA